MQEKIDALAQYDTVKVLKLGSDCVYSVTFINEIFQNK
jgi:hypothetical protein